MEILRMCLLNHFRHVCNCVSPISALKTMLAELTDKSNEAVAQTGFAVRVLSNYVWTLSSCSTLLQIAYRLGQGIGQPIGGLLSHPERHFSLFDTPFWRKHPFSLPGLLSGTVAMVLVVFGYCMLGEASEEFRLKKFVFSSR